MKPMTMEEKNGMIRNIVSSLLLCATVLLGILKCIIGVNISWVLVLAPLWLYAGLNGVIATIWLTVCLMLCAAYITAKERGQ